MEESEESYLPKPLEFRCLFRVAKEKYSPYEIREELSHSLIGFIESKGSYTLMKGDLNNNRIQLAVKEIFRRRFLSSENINAYLVDYSEEQGSLVISFTILVFGALSNYGSIRETIDYFADDLEKLFDNSLNNNSNGGYYVNSKVVDQNNKSLLFQQGQISRTRKNKFDGRDYNILATKIKINRILIGIVFFFFILSSATNYLLVENPNDKDMEDARTILLIKDEIRNQRIEELLRSRIDTIYVKVDSVR